MDNDGKMDVLASSFQGEIHLMKGNGKGRFSKNVILKSGDVNAASNLNSNTNVPMFTTAMDLDGDGNKDLIIGCFNSTVYTIKAQDGSFEKFAKESDQLKVGKSVAKVGYHPVPVVADWNGDKKLDIILADSEGEIFFLENIGSKDKAMFAKSKLIWTAANDEKSSSKKLPVDTISVGVADYNSDGKLDLLIGGKTPNGTGGIWVYFSE